MQTLATKLMSQSRGRLHLFLVVIVVFSLATTAGGALANPLSLNDITTTYKGFQNTWYNSIHDTAERLFWILVSVDFAWTGVLYVLEKNDIGEIAIGVAKKILQIGFFYSLLKFAGTWIPNIIDSFAKIGTTAGQVGDATPDGIVSVGLGLAEAAFASMKDLSLIDSIAVVFPVSLVAIATFLSYLFVAAQLLVTLVESYLAIGAGIILLGFGGSRWTTDFATKYLQYAVGTGIKLMLIYLIVGAGQTLAAKNQIDPKELIHSCFVMLGVALVYAYLAIQVPAMASAMMSGSPSMTAGALASSAITLGAAAAGAGAIAKGGGAAALSGGVNAAAGMSGLGKALGAGLDVAADHGLTGMNAGMSAVGAVSGQAAAMAAGGIGSAITGASGGFSEKVAGSAGGKIASNLNDSRGGSFSGASAPAGPAQGSGAGAPSQSAAPSAPASNPAASPGASPAPASGATPAAMPGSAPAIPSAAASTQAAGPVASDKPVASAPPASADGDKATPAAPPSANPNVGSNGSAEAQAFRASRAAPAGPLGSGPAPAAAGVSPEAAGVQNGLPAGNAQDFQVGPDSGGRPADAHGEKTPTDPKPSGQGSARSDPLHSKIRDLQGFVPSDQAGGAGGIHIEIGHVKD